MKMNFEISEEQVSKNFMLLRKMIDNKETQLKEKLNLEKDTKIKALDTQKDKVTELKQRIEGIRQIIDEGIEKPDFVLESGQKFVDKRIELCEDQISSGLLSREEVQSEMPKMLDIQPLNKIFENLEFEKQIETSSKYEESKYGSSNFNDINTSNRDDESSKTEEIRIKSHPDLSK